MLTDPQNHKHPFDDDALVLSAWIDYVLDSGIYLTRPESARLALLSVELLLSRADDPELTKALTPTMDLLRDAVGTRKRVTREYTKHAANRLH